MIDPVRWNPPQPYSLDVEVIPLPELWTRGTPEHFRRPQRLEFFMLIGVTAGKTLHVLDFQTHALQSGDWILARPGQVQQFGPQRGWDGCIVVFVPGVLPQDLGSAEANALLATDPGTGAGRGHVRLSPAAHAEACRIVATMRRDAGAELGVRTRHALLLHELCLLLLRLGQAVAASPERVPEQGRQRQRVLRLRKLIEERHAEHWPLTRYCKALNCTERTLHRAAIAVTGDSPARLIQARLALEARRWLAHSAEPVAQVAARLGFDEPGNFGKFFRREAGCTPLEFRRRYR